MPFSGRCVKGCVGWGRGKKITVCREEEKGKFWGKGILGEGGKMREMKNVNERQKAKSANRTNWDQIREKDYHYIIKNVGEKVVWNRPDQQQRGKGKRGKHIDN